MYEESYSAVGPMFSRSGSASEVKELSDFELLSVAKDGMNGMILPGSWCEMRNISLYSLAFVS